MKETVILAAALLACAPVHAQELTLDQAMAICAQHVRPPHPTNPKFRWEDGWDHCQTLADKREAAQSAARSKDDEAQRRATLKAAGK